MIIVDFWFCDGLVMVKFCLFFIFMMASSSGHLWASEEINPRNTKVVKYTLDMEKAEFSLFQDPDRHRSHYTKLGVRIFNIFYLHFFFQAYFVTPRLKEKKNLEIFLEGHPPKTRTKFGCKIIGSTLDVHIFKWLNI